jgi:phenylacetate-CoA ligase
LLTSFDVSGSDVPMPTAHDIMSRRLLLPFQRLQRRVRPSRRQVMRAFDEGMRFRRNAETWDLEKKQDWVLARLRFSVRRAYQDTQYYRELFDAVGFDPEADFSFDDFARLPVLEREDVGRAGSTLVSRTIPGTELKRDATGGSTGLPTVVWLGPEERGWREGATEYPMERISVPQGTSVGLLWGHHLDPVARQGLRDRFHDFESNMRWFDCFRLSPEILDRYHRQFERWRPACIVAYASGLASLADHVLANGYRPGYPTRCAVTGAEKLFAEQRARIEQAFGRPVHERYGSRDIGVMAFQFAPNRSHSYDVDWTNVLLEPETEAVEASILVTKLHGDGMPMLRYRIGDVARFPEDNHPGHPAFTLHEVLGRHTDRVWLRDGRWINGIQLPHLLKDHPVREFMLIQRPDYSVELRLVPGADFGETSRTGILQTICENLPGLPIQLIIVDEVPRSQANKWRPVMTEAAPPSVQHS